jgi:hypothetical protein
MKKSSVYIPILFFLPLFAAKAGAQWKQLAFASDAVNSLAVAGTNLYAGTYWLGVNVSMDNGESWKPMNSGLGNHHVYSLALNDAYIFAGMYGGGFYRCAMQDTNWTFMSIPSVNNVNLFVFGTHLFAATEGDGIFFSNNNGSTWYPANSGLTSMNVWSLASNGSSIFAGTDAGVFLSTNNGTNWIAANSGLTNLLVYRLAISGPNVIAATWGGPVFLSTNEGINWNVIGSGLGNDTIMHAFAINGPYVFAGTMRKTESDTARVLRSTNNGESWTDISNGLPGNDGFFSLAVNGEYVFVGTFSAGIWRRALSEITSVGSLSQNASSEFYLEQNYPNPFNPTTEIRFSLPRASHVTLKIYNTLGKEVTTLVNEKLAARTYAVEWNASGLASGVYLYRLQAGEFIETKRLTLLK